MRHFALVYGIWPSSRIEPDNECHTANNMFCTHSYGGVTLYQFFGVLYKAEFDFLTRLPCCPRIAVNGGSI